MRASSLELLRRDEAAGTCVRPPVRGEPTGHGGRLVLTFSILLLGLCGPANVLGDLAQEVVPPVITNDTPTKFDASGVWRGIDSNANTVLAAVGMTLPGTVNWSFTLGMSAGGLPAGGDATNVQNTMVGTHITAPHAGDIANNPLPLIADFAPRIPFWQQHRFAASGRADHPNVKHYDLYSFKETAEVGTRWVNVGTPPVPTLVGDLTKSYSIRARHYKPDFPKLTVPAGKGVGVRKGQSAYVSFISDGGGGGRLQFDIGAIDILDDQGGQSGGIAPQYAGDPLLNCVLTVEDMPLLGTDPDGSFLFAGGQLAITDPNGILGFAGQLGDYFINDTSATNPVDSFGFFESLAVGGPEAPDPEASQFLLDFIDTNMFGIGLGGDAERLMGTDFTFHTTVSLATLTNGFTQSVFDVPATVLIMANLEVPEPSSLLLLAGGIVAAVRRRRSG